MSQTKEPRNKRIMELRGVERRKRFTTKDGRYRYRKTGDMTWREIAAIINKEFPEYDADGNLKELSWQRCSGIYQRDVNGVEDPGTVYQRKHGINYRKRKEDSGESDSE